MAKKKDNIVTETVKPDFSDKTIADLYEAQVVLAIKLDTLINLFDKVVDHIEKKEKGQLGIG